MEQNILLFPNVNESPISNSGSLSLTVFVSFLCREYTPLLIYLKSRDQHEGSWVPFLGALFRESELLKLQQLLRHFNPEL